MKVSAGITIVKQSLSNLTRTIYNCFKYSEMQLQSWRRKYLQRNWPVQAEMFDNTYTSSQPYSIIVCNKRVWLDATNNYIDESDAYENQHLDEYDTKSAKQTFQKYAYLSEMHYYSITFLLQY